MLNEENILYLDGVVIGQRIREVRKSKGIKSVDLAAQLNLSADQYCRIESGKSTCSLKNLYLISQYLQVSTDYILFGRKKYDTLLKIVEILNGKSEREVDKARRVLEALFV